jgi:hypothetical protein
VQLDVAVGEEDEGGRGDGGLGHVEDANALGHGHRRALEVDLVEEAVHLPGGDALAALGGHGHDLVQHASMPFGFRARPFERGEKDHRRVAQVFEHRAQLLSKISRSAGGLPSVRPVVTASHLLTTMMTLRPLSWA